MEDELYQGAERFFKGLKGSQILKEQMKECNQVIQFDPDKGQPFYIQISQGKVDFGKGKRAIEKGGRFDSKYQITVPRTLSQS